MAEEHTPDVKSSIKERIQMVWKGFVYFLFLYVVLTALGVLFVGPVFAYLKYGAWTFPVWATLLRLTFAVVIAATISTIGIWLLTEWETRKSRK